jgi:hypothetical protein
MITIHLPERGLTLLPPWPQAIAFAGKRLENRGYGVARQIGEWRGMVAISHSASWQMNDAIKAGEDLSNRHLATWPQLRRGDTKQWAGKVVLVAELVDVLPPERCVGDPWHVPGQWGLILGRVWEVEPVAVSGGHGCWEGLWCTHCRRIQADSQGDTCRSCKSDSMGRYPKRPELKVIRECVI